MPKVEKTLFDTVTGYNPFSMVYGLNKGDAVLVDEPNICVDNKEKKRKKFSISGRQYKWHIIIGVIIVILASAYAIYVVVT